MHVIHLQPAPVRQTMVSQLWRLTRDGGLIAVANYSTHEAGYATWDPYPEPNTRVDPKGKVVHFFDEAEIKSLFPSFDVVRIGTTSLARRYGGVEMKRSEVIALLRSPA